MTGRPGAVSVRIGRLVVEGASPAERRLVLDGAHTRLVEAVIEWMESGAAAAWEPAERRRRVVRAAVTLPVDGSPSELGRSIGSAVAGAVFEVEP